MGFTVTFSYMYGVIYLIYYLIYLCACMCTCLSMCAQRMQVPMEVRRGHQNSQGWSTYSQLWSHFSIPCLCSYSLPSSMGSFLLGSLSPCGSWGWNTGVRLGSKHFYGQSSLPCPDFINVYQAFTKQQLLEARKCSVFLSHCCFRVLFRWFSLKQ